LGPARSGDIVLVLSNRADAYALERARQAGIPAHHISATDEAGLLEFLSHYQVDLIALAGYLKLIPAGVTRRYAGRMLNVHPGPLPAFGGPGMYGHKVHAAVLAAGVKQTEVTVHIVDEEYDHGATIARWPVPVHPGDTPESLAARVLAVEHIVYPRVLDALAATLSLS
jgi:folate-dependent phosphoribosylglycinamide formyltransferase PurN